MSRVQTPDFGQVGLRPVAQPTNQFYSPEVRRPENGNRLIDLANALSVVNPQLQQIVDRQFQAHVQGSELRATADAAKYDSMKQLREAVSKGQIAEQDNPWYMVAIKQNVASKEADDAAIQIRDQYYHDEIQHEDNPAVVEQWLKAKTKPLLEGRDMWELQAFAPKMEHATKAILAEHIDRRRGEREEEMEQGFKTAIDSMIGQAYGASPTLTVTPTAFGKDTPARGETIPAAQVMTQLASSIQTKLDSAGRAGVNWTKANQWAVEAVGNAALENQDASLAEQVLSQIKTTGGNTLLDAPGAKLMVDKVRREIVSRQAEDSAREERQRQLVNHRTAISLYDKAKHDLSELQKTNPAATLFDVIPSYEELRKIGVAPESITEMQQQAMSEFRDAKALQGDADKDKLSKLTLDYLNADTPKQQKSVAEMLLTLSGGSNAILDVDRIKYNIKHNADIETDPAARDTLDHALLEGTLTPKTFWSVADKLSPEDRNRYLGHIYQDQKKDDAGIFGRDGGAMLEAEDIQNRILERSFAAAQQEDPSITIDYFRQNDPRYYDAVVAGQKARSKLLKDFNNWLIDPANATATSQDKIKKLNELSESIAPKVVKAPATQPVAVQKPKESVAPVDKDIEGIGSNNHLLEGITHDDLMQYNQVLNTPVKATKNSIPMEAQVSIHNWDSFSMPAFADLMKVRGEVAAGTTLFGYTYGGGKYSEEQAKRELQSYNDSIKARQMTEQEMSRQKVVEKFKGLLDQVKQQGGVPTYDQKFWIANYRNQFKELALSISRVGLTPEEAKKIGPQVYNVVPLFANLQDIQSRGKDVAKELGLSGEGEVKFINAQIDIYKRNSKEAMIDSPARGLFRGED